MSGRKRVLFRKISLVVYTIHLFCIAHHRIGSSLLHHSAKKKTMIHLTQCEMAKVAPAEFCKKSHQALSDRFGGFGDTPFLDWPDLQTWANRPDPANQSAFEQFFFATSTWFVSASQVSKVSTTKLRQLKIVREQNGQPAIERLWSTHAGSS